MCKIEQIIYLPTTRCNLNCQHCGESQDINASEEIDCLEVLNKIKNSIRIDTDLIEISGGEPFLNKSLYNFIVNLINDTEYRIYITSNGWFTDEILSLVDQISYKNKNRISFSISVDGSQELHNKIRRNKFSYQKAIQTVKGLSERNINVGINIVV